MFIRLIAAIITASLQCGALWVSMYCGLKLLHKYDTSIHHHHGVAFGILIYYLLMSGFALIVIINVSVAIFNKSIVTWLTTGISIGIMLAIFGDNPAYAPWRMLFLLVGVIPLFGVTGWMNKVVSRLLLRVMKKGESRN